jgi:peptide methionine sulfoxide reductase msrA/msrB
MTMLRWNDVVRYADHGNPHPERSVRKSEEQWRARLTPEQFRVARQKGTESAFSSEMCGLFEPGLYACVCCGTELFASTDKFKSGSGWPSFTQPIKPNGVAYHWDNSHGMQRIETTCNTCEAHLGHVFPDGPAPSGLRYCINGVALKKISGNVRTATFGGGCFWCTEAVFKAVEGVLSVESGYSGGTVSNPTYQQVCGGGTGHAEVVQITFDPQMVSYADLVRIHLASHDPTTLNRQGADVGTQYRSVILAHDAEQEHIAQQVIAEVQTLLQDPIVTEVQPFTVFYRAEESHQDYFVRNPNARYCLLVIEPKLRKLREQLSGHLRQTQS